MSTATARAYQPHFAGRFMPSRTRKSPQNKAFYGHRGTYSGKAHCIKDRVLLDGACGTGGMLTVAQDRLETLALRRNKKYPFIFSDKSYNLRRMQFVKQICC